jgi:hypothetical protein
MKFALASAFVLGAAAIDTQPPVIKLDLDEQVLKNNRDQVRSAHKLPARDHTRKAASESNYVHVCVAKKATAATCPLPAAKAYDHHDGLLEVTRKIYLVNNDGTPVGVDSNNDGIKEGELKRAIDYNLRSEWVAKYDASDSAGNAAEQVVFAIILNDPIAPDFTSVPAGGHVEAGAKGSSYTVPSAKAVDNYDGSNVAYTITPRTIDTGVLGSVKVAYTATDKARGFGYNGASNTKSTTVTFTVADTTKPDLTVSNVAASYECASATYTAAPAKCADIHDGVISVVRTGTVDTKKVGTYSVNYNCKDSSNNAAPQITKTYKTVDTTNPILTVSTKNVVNGVLQHHAGEDDQAHKIAHVQKYLEGYSCNDSCDGTIKPSATWSPAWDASKVGTYRLKYGCVDASGNGVTQTRTVINEDIHKPVLNLIGASTLSVEGSQIKSFEDLGATCVDKFDGDISTAVRVSGDLVDLRKLGTYTIKYACKDKAGNAADGQTRKVVVFDDYCPTCTINGASSVTREASFPYSDQGAVCSDHHDGKTAVVTTGSFDVEKVGVYKLTYRSKDAAGNWNDGAKCHCGGARPAQTFCPTSYVRTITVQDTLKPVISLSYGANTFHKSAATDKGVNGQANPAALMAETQTSVNGWVVGAVASAVTGVALLGFSMKKTTATSVPV